MVACNKDDDPTPQLSEIDKLPPTSQTGANKVGCLVNGKAFLPSGQLAGSTNPYCGYFQDKFSLVFRIVKNEDNITGNGTESVAIYSANIILTEGEKYILKNDNSNHSGIYRINRSNNFESYETNENYTGELHVTKLDKINNVISGTFWFDAINSQGKKVEIREGRFDMVFEGWTG